MYIGTAPSFVCWNDMKEQEQGLLSLTMNTHRSSSSWTLCLACWGGRECDPWLMQAEMAHVFHHFICILMLHFLSSHGYSEWVWDRIQSSCAQVSRTRGIPNCWNMLHCSIHILLLLAVLFIFFLIFCSGFQILHSPLESQIYRWVYDGISAPHSFSISAASGLLSELNVLRSIDYPMSVPVM